MMPHRRKGFKERESYMCTNMEPVEKRIQTLERAKTLGEATQCFPCEKVQSESPVHNLGAGDPRHSQRHS